MNTELLIAILVSFLPLIELRGGLPLIVDYCLRNGISILPYFILIIFVNILITPFVFFFMDFLHDHFMKIKIYSNFMNKYLEKVKRKGKHLENKEGFLLQFLLFTFVAIPLPGTGAWTGAILVWLLGLKRKISFVSISIGVLFAGIIMLGLSFGVLHLFY